ncbi:Magnesium protoporphyrin IX methyltransferase, chloroplastic [Porphyridium purpureum]|uniref:Magnesium protoporphyrin IX methyltransferase, chloroplastic n=1 Tax=Porphyridium purpureum TaxID=35688 RepID=A0A5J4YIZ1_PORPP|nr:Magnesium protoporphyrin IX methyltransferase, chloroplastic [Porphyridium purpureum]|eukprot:POR8515..scf251_18
MAFVASSGWAGGQSRTTVRLCAPRQAVRNVGARVIPARGPVMQLTQKDDKKEVEEYFNNTGFERWNKIYSEDAEVNNVQKDIRTGHNQTIQRILAWIDADGDAQYKTFCDAGCGVGSLAIPLTQRGAIVSASDISAAMVKEARERADVQLGDKAMNVSFAVSDLENLSGSYDTVFCIDVMIHYPDEKLKEMISHLSNCAERRMIITFAPYTILLGMLKSFGSLFPGPSKATRAYLHSESYVEGILKELGWQVKRRDFVKSKFYFSTILEAVKQA